MKTSTTRCKSHPLTSSRRFPTRLAEIPAISSSATSVPKPRQLAQLLVRRQRCARVVVSKRWMPLNPECYDRESNNSSWNPDSFATCPMMFPSFCNGGLAKFTANGPTGLYRPFFCAHHTVSFPPKASRIKHLSTSRPRCQYASPSMQQLRRPHSLNNATTLFVLS